MSNEIYLQEMCEIWGSHLDDIKNIFSRDVKPCHLLENTDPPEDGMTSIKASVMFVSF
jgi:hypothetical protein